MSRLDGARTGTRTTGDVHSQSRIAVEGVQTAVAIESVARVAAVEAASRLRVALVGVAVALAALTRREVPESWLALVAHASVRVGSAATQTAAGVAEAVQGPDRIALAVGAPARTEAERSRCALIAAATDHVGFALALTAQRVADAAVRSSLVALALDSGSQDVEADAVQELLAHVGDFGFEHRVEILGAAVLLEFLPALVGRWRSVEEGNAVGARDHRDGIDEHRSRRRLLAAVVGAEHQPEVVVFVGFQAHGWIHYGVTAAGWKCYRIHLLITQLAEVHSIILD